MTNMQKKKFRKVLFICFTLITVLTLSVVICAAEDIGDAGGFGNVLGDFIEILIGGLERMGSGLGGGINNYVRELFFTVDASGNVTGLSTFGGVSAIFGGVALAVGLTTLIFNWIRSLGN